ncbi:DUF2255 family protein [Frankia sp. Mgl5]|uniref:DUF2255 family protein n=1 Tax=Frankia sp. Mgl5 TaxID=2933793 RepID=UPI00200E07EF|nr:DUF2255 family protein [Frankia sp. Mgl5]MCK9932478.1 DUF2255 family protein [Frankia sp. Mgl5]
MTPWTDQELDRVGRASELRVAGRRPDGTLRGLVTIWSVRVGDSIYVRSVYGPESAWFRGTRTLGEGRIEVGGITKDVTFALDPTLDDKVNAAYRAKYGAGGPVRAITSDPATRTTLRIDPR